MDAVFLVICEGKKYRIECSADQFQQELTGRCGIPVNLQKILVVKTGQALCHGLIASALADLVAQSANNTIMLVIQRLPAPNASCSCLCGSSSSQGGAAVVAPRSNNSAASRPAAPQSRVWPQQPLHQNRPNQPRRIVVNTGGSGMPSQEDQKRVQEERVFYNRLSHNLASIRSMENPDWLAFARSVIPLRRLKELGDKRFEEHQKDWKERREEEKNKRDVLDAKDCLLLELMSWFKKDFYEWVNEAPCAACGEKKTIFCGMQPPSQEDLRFGARRVEGYKCPKLSCGRLTRFPRYNHAKRLLEIGCRRGRCGEWAQAFTLVVRACELDVRMAHDWTDHVWLEVWSDARKAWIHCDPCENQRDRPLTYEAGWKKKLSYIISFHRTHAIDTTKRYTRDFEGCLTRRPLPEERVAEYLKNINTRLLISSRASEEQRNQIVQRLESERKEIEEEYEQGMAMLREDEKQGRVSGSTAWRVQRGESRLRETLFDWDIPSDLKNRQVQFEDDMRETRVVGKRHPDTEKYVALKDLATRTQLHPREAVSKYRLAEIRIWSDNFVHGMQLVYELNNDSETKALPTRVECEARGDCNASGSVVRSVVVLAEGEYITRMGGRSGDIMDHLALGTSHGRKLEFGLSEGGSPWVLLGPREGFPLLCGLALGTGGHIHHIAAYYKTPIPE